MAKWTFAVYNYVKGIGYVLDLKKLRWLVNKQKLKDTMKIEKNELKEGK